MSSKLQNSIWPNINGNLGNIKAQIPDGVTTLWPEGDALVHNFVYQNGKIVGFVDTKALIVNDSKSTTIPYDYVNIQVDKSLEGVMTFNRGERTKYFTVTYTESGNSGDTIMFKYKGCKTVDDIKAVDSDYLTNDIVNGVWTEGLGDLEQGGNGSWNGGMFYYCDNLTSFSSDLPSLTDGSWMFSQCKNLTSFSSDLPSLSNGYGMFYYTSLSQFTSELPSLTDGSCMFENCTNLSAFSSDLPSLTSGNEMFSYCANLESFSSDLSSLTNGDYMFYVCTALTSFTSDLSSLTNGEYMFYDCTALTSFDSNLSSLTNGERMFQGCSNLYSFFSHLPSLTDGTGMFINCTNLNQFYSDLSSLSNGSSMFYYCSKLYQFDADLSSLTDGSDMFYGCKLDGYSVQNIADTINTVSNNNRIDIGIDKYEPDDGDIAAFNKMTSKGWIVYVNGRNINDGYGGYYGIAASASLTTLEELGESEMFNPKPYWAKPVPSDEEHAKYTDSEGNFYNILGAQFIYGDSLDTYGMFTSLEDAAAQMRLKKIGEEEIETA